MSYHRRNNHKQMSGQYAHLIGKQITWSESFDQVTWFEASGKVEIVHTRTQAFSVDTGNASCGVYTDDVRIRNIRVDGKEIFPDRKAVV